MQGLCFICLPVLLSRPCAPLPAVQIGFHKTLPAHVCSCAALQRAHHGLLSRPCAPLPVVHIKFPHIGSHRILPAYVCWCAALQRAHHGLLSHPCAPLPVVHVRFIHDFACSRLLVRCAAACTPRNTLAPMCNSTSNTYLMSTRFCLLTFAVRCTAACAPRWRSTRGRWSWPRSARVQPQNPRQLRTALHPGSLRGSGMAQPQAARPRMTRSQCSSRWRSWMPLPASRPRPPRRCQARGTSVQLDSATALNP